MPYNTFTWSRVKQDFGLSTIETTSFLSDIAPVTPSLLLQQELERKLPWATLTSNEKARSEALINPILLEVRALFKGTISVFSGERFDVDHAADLTGFCDFLLSQSAEQVAIEAPVVVVVEAKQDNIKSGLEQCAATRVAAQKFNQAEGRPQSCIFGSVSTGTVWRFLQLEEQVLTLDLVD